MAGEGVTAMIVAADAGDNPLADRREDRKAAAERERKAKVAKVASQATNAMAAVRAQLDLREKGAADKAANKANDDAGAPVRASSTMLERVFAARLDGPDKYVVARRKERKTAAGAGTAADLAAGLEKMADSVVKMARRDGADGQYQTTLTLTRNLGPGALFTRARDVQTGLPGESEWRGSRLAQQRERCALHGGT